MFACVGSQVTLCDPIWQVTLRRCVIWYVPLTAIQYLYLVFPAPPPFMRALLSRSCEDSRSTPNVRGPNTTTTATHTTTNTSRYLLPPTPLGLSVFVHLIACPYCRRKVRLSPNLATAAVVSPFSATVALFCDSVDRALGFLLSRAPVSLHSLKVEGHVPLLPILAPTLVVRASNVTTGSIVKVRLMFYTSLIAPFSKLIWRTMQPL